MGTQTPKLAWHPKPRIQIRNPKPETRNYIPPTLENPRLIPQTRSLPDPRYSKPQNPNTVIPLALKPSIPGFHSETPNRNPQTQGGTELPNLGATKNFKAYTLSSICTPNPSPLKPSPTNPSHHKPETLNLKPQTPNPEPQTSNPKP